MVNFPERISVNPEVCHGKPTIRGSRLLVSTILELLSSGMTIEEIIEDYSGLEEADILACLAFAARLTDFKTFDMMPAA